MLDQRGRESLLNLKRRFISVPILIIPGLSHQFVVEVDTSNTDTPVLEGSCPRGLHKITRKDVSSFVAVCDICVHCKHDNCTPAGLLRPLPVPHYPRSHISLDFLMGLPSSDGSTCIMTIVDHFFKTIHLVPLPKLLSAKETTEQLILHVYCLHGLPTDIVSD